MMNTFGLIVRCRAMAITVALLPAASLAADLPERLPDTEVTTGEAIAEAWLIDPTARYDHGILGDTVEAGGLAVSMPDGGRILTYRLADQYVFEDRRVRLWDIDGDGREELVVVKTDLDRGAALAVFGLIDDTITPLVETPPIGSSHRWLNPIGAADLDGNGTIEIAYVDRPHILGRLTVVSFRDGRLIPLGTLDGTTNHLIGTRQLDLAVLADVAGNDRPEIVVPTHARNDLLAVALDDEGLTVVGRAPLPAPVNGPVVFDGNELTATLEGGRVVRLDRQDFVEP